MRKGIVNSFKSSMQKAAAETNVAISDKQLDLYYIYFHELLEWNKKTNITAIHTPEDIIIKHFIDSLIVINHVDLSGRLADIGSGGGFPGIPLKIKKPEIELTLIEAKRKKASFLRHIIRTLRLDHIEVYNGRAEDFEKKDYFDYTISRAFSSLGSFLSVASPLVRPGGCIISMQGKKAEQKTKDDTLPDSSLKIKKAVSFELPHRKGSRTLLVIEKCFT